MQFVRPVPRGLVTSCNRDAAQVTSQIFRCASHGEHRVYSTGRIERIAGGPGSGTVSEREPA
jgi:hypothetical protein